MAKLRPGMREKENGSIEYRFVIDGKRYSVCAKSVREVLQKEQEKRQAIATGTYKNNKNVTLGEYYNEWIEHKKAELKSGSIQRYKSVWKKHIEGKPIEKRPVCRIERRELMQMQTELGERNPRLANDVLSLIRTILNDAIRDEIIDKNPASFIKALKTKQDAGETIHRALTKDEQKLFMQYAKKQWLYEMMALMLLTGIRSGEAAALKMSDIDLKENIIHIRRTLAIGENGLIENAPKSAAGLRDIPLTATAKKIVLQQMAKGVTDIDGHLFLTAQGTLVSNRSLIWSMDAVFADLEKDKHKIERFTSHAFRDTFATRYLEQGGNMKTLQTILGHSKIAMTMDVYAHVLPNTKKDEMDRINIVV